MTAPWESGNLCNDKHRLPASDSGLSAEVIAFARSGAKFLQLTQRSLPTKERPPRSHFGTYLLLSRGIQDRL